MQWYVYSDRTSFHLNGSSGFRNLWALCMFIVIYSLFSQRAIVFLNWFLQGNGEIIKNCHWCCNQPFCIISLHLALSVAVLLSNSKSVVLHRFRFLCLMSAFSVSRRLVVWQPRLSLCFMAHSTAYCKAFWALPLWSMSIHPESFLCWWHQRHRTYQCPFLWKSSQLKWASSVPIWCLLNSFCLKPLWLSPVNVSTLGRMHCRVMIEQSYAHYSNEHWDGDWLVGVVDYLDKVKPSEYSYLVLPEECAAQG